MQLIFVHIQKTGGSSLAASIGQKVLSPHKHRFASELRDIYGPEIWNSAYRFAFVRNPWDRLVSWWAMMETFRPQYEAGQPMGNFFSYIFRNAPSFEAFIVNCTEDIEDANGRKCIFRNQLDYINDHNGARMVDFVGRFENLNSDFNHVLLQAGREPRPLPHFNKTPHRPYQDYYTPRTRLIVEDAYARDIAEFGYRFDSVDTI